MSWFKRILSWASTAYDLWKQRRAAKRLEKLP